MIIGQDTTSLQLIHDIMVTQMTKPLPKPKILLLANTCMPQVAEALERFRPWLQQRATIVAEPVFKELTAEKVKQLPKADMAMVFGGDGTLLSQARQIVDLDLPLLGINFGKLGFLAEFRIADIKMYWDQIASGTCPISPRLMLGISVYDADVPLWANHASEKFTPQLQTVALNDAVITAGPPFRMIDLELAIDPGPGESHITKFSADGVIISTPSGSTAYNLSAGGPIVSPGIDAVCITPLCPHTLAFRPIVVNANSDVWVRVSRTNEKGTALVIDGQQSIEIQTGQQLLIRRYEHAVKLVQNPQIDYWQILARKLRWAARPRREG